MYNVKKIKIFVKTTNPSFFLNKRLQRAKKRINLLLEEIENYYWDFKIEKNLIELRNLATVAKLIIVSAISRKEFRGIHYNIDHPNKADLIRPTLIRKPW